RGRSRRPHSVRADSVSHVPRGASSLREERGIRARVRAGVSSRRAQLCRWCQLQRLSQCTVLQHDDLPPLWRRRRYRGHAIKRLMCALPERDAQVASPPTRRSGSRWRRHLFQKKESIKTTWKLRLAIVLLPLLVIPLTRSFWSVSIGQSLTCTETIARSDIILVENIDPDYLLFERAATLRHAGLASR